ncbi:hypothetical protein [Saccharopolyspora shandongensis]|uniref:hypothetical protein n=1 Tax=Saccharopolyspora shandongensis TaxID=418495 RepID=UPI0033F4BC8C
MSYSTVDLGAASTSLYSCSASSRSAGWLSGVVVGIPENTLNHRYDKLSPAVVS